MFIFGIGLLIFDVGGSKSFIIDVIVGMLFIVLCEKINNFDENFGVIVNIIDIGIGVGFWLVFFFSEIGDGNDLVIINDIGVVELDCLLMIGGINNISVVNIESVRNVIVYIDGIEV